MQDPRQASDDSGKVYQVEAPLDEIVRHFYYMTTRATDRPVIKSLMPNYEVMLVFNFGANIRFGLNDEVPGRFTATDIGLLGPLRKMLNFELQPGTDALVVVFTLNGFYRLFNLPVHELAEKDFYDAEAFDKLLAKLSPGKEISFLTDTWQQLNASTDPQQRMKLLSLKISALINESEPAFDLLAHSIAYFEDPGLQPSKVLAKDTNLSERTVQQRFQKYLGFSSKEMLRFIRFKKVMNQILANNPEEIDLFELIHNYGYHDQSHIIKDFNFFLGTTPAKFVKDIAGKEFCVSKPGKHY